MLMAQVAKHTDFNIATFLKVTRWKGRMTGSSIYTGSDEHHMSSVMVIGVRCNAISNMLWCSSSYKATGPMWVAVCDLAELCYPPTWPTWCKSGWPKIMSSPNMWPSNSSSWTTMSGACKELKLSSPISKLLTI